MTRYKDVPQQDCQASGVYPLIRFLHFVVKVQNIFPKHHTNKNNRNNLILYSINKLLRNFLSELLTGQQRLCASINATPSVGNEKLLVKLALGFPST
jgi:hypothetical protein